MDGRTEGMCMNKRERERDRDRWDVCVQQPGREGGGLDFRMDPCWKPTHVPLQSNTCVNRLAHPE